MIYLDSFALVSQLDPIPVSSGLIGEATDAGVSAAQAAGIEPTSPSPGQAQRAAPSGRDQKRRTRSMRRDRPTVVPTSSGPGRSPSLHPPVAELDLGWSLRVHEVHGRVV
jgi:hypothetical protein